MKKKALILGAVPPFIGPWVPISEARQWCPIVVTVPNVALNGQVTIRTRDGSGHTTVVPHTERISGYMAQAVVGEMEGVDSISVIIEGVGDG